MTKLLLKKTDYKKESESKYLLDEFTFEDPIRELVFFFPRGVGHKTKDGHSRIPIHKRIWEYAYTRNLNDENLPLEDVNHKVLFVPEPSNTYDKNAMRMIFTSDDPKFSNCNGKELGYVSRTAASKYYFKFGVEITSGIIWQVSDKYFGKFYNCIVVASYGNQKISRSMYDIGDFRRFNLNLE